MGAGPWPAASAVLCALLALLLLPSVASSETDPGLAETVAGIDWFVEEQLDSNGVPGAAMVIVDAGGRSETRTFGKSGRGDESVGPQTPFLICSVTKSFTALATMQLFDRGLLDLEDPVGEYLPWFEVEPAEDSDAVTVRTFLNQTSGLSALAGGEEMRYISDLSILDTARSLSGETLQSRPGEEFEYANGNYVLLGAVIEAASGTTYQAFLERNVLAPLGMQHTWLGLDEARQNGMAEGHRYWFGMTFAHTSWSTGLIPAGGVISTAPDMGRYLRMMLNEGRLGEERVLSAKGIRTMTRPAVEATVGPWAKDPDVSYGMGWYVGGGPFGSKDAVFHPGGSPDFGSMAAFLPDEGVAMDLLYNVTPEVSLPGAAGDVDRIGAGVISLLMGDEPKEGWSMYDYYLAFDLVVAVLFGLCVWLLVRAFRRPWLAGSTRFQRISRPAATIGLLLLALVLLTFPFLTGLGWQVLFLSVPDFTLALLVLGLLLLAVGVLRLVQLVRLFRARGVQPRAS